MNVSGRVRVFSRVILAQIDRVRLSEDPHPRSLSHWERDDSDSIGVWVRANVTMKIPYRRV